MNESRERSHVDAEEYGWYIGDWNTRENVIDLF
jgi:hypothetical protein